MATLKYSRQRASIKEYLDHTTEHPTADTVYLHVREEFPRISLGTSLILTETESESAC